MPASAAPEIPVSEAEIRLGITEPSKEEPRATRADPASSPAVSQASPVNRSHDSLSEGLYASNTGSLPASLLTKRVKPVTVSRTFRLPLALANELEQVSALHDIPMVTILAEALELHLARFPRQKTT